MLDGVSLDQMRAFIAAVDEGSFSAGARKLHRAQSVVSELVSVTFACRSIELGKGCQWFTHRRVTGGVGRGANFPLSTQS